MSNGEIANYEGALGDTEMVVDGHCVYMLIYNDTGAALANGDVVVLDWGADADSLDPTTYFTVAVPATSAVQQQFGVVNNVKRNKSTIPDGEWGFIQLRGYCPDINTALTSVAAGRFLQAANGVATAADDGTTMTSDSIAVVVGTVFNTTHFACILLGRPAIIG